MSGGLECQNPDCMCWAEVSFELCHKDTHEVQRFYFCASCARGVMDRLQVQPRPVTESEPSLN